MTIEEFKEDLNDYMGKGTFTVKEVDNNRIHIIWNNNGNYYSSVIESRLLEMQPRVICEEVVKPIVMSFKNLARREEIGGKIMTELQEEIAEIKQTLKAMQADIEIIKRYNGGVYDYDIAEEPPYIPTQACSLEDQMNAIKKYDEYCERHPEFIGGLVKGE